MAYFDVLSDLDPHKSNWSVRVKVLKLWSEDFLVGKSMEMIISDEHGTRFQASVRPNHVHLFEESIKEGDWHIFHWFKVTKDPEFGLKCCLYPLKIIFLRKTVVLPSGAVTDSLLVWPSRFFDILDRAYGPNDLIDVVGVVHSVGELRQIPSRNGSGVFTNLRFELVNAERDIILPCYARESVARELYWEFKKTEVEHIVCVLRFWLAAEGHGIDAKSAVLSCTCISQFMVNPVDPIVQDVLSRYLAK